MRIRRGCGSGRPRTFPASFSEDYLAQQRRTLGEVSYAREYLGVPMGTHTSPFTWYLYDRAVRVHTPLVAMEPRVRRKDL